MIHFKTLVSTLSLMAVSVCASAQQTDSVYIKAYCPSPKDGLRIAYSSDMKTWVNIDRNLFTSDYGTWGSEKKMYTPTLTYQDGKFHCEFVPNPNVAELAVTESEDLWLWKPQNYPRIPKEQWEAMKARMQQATNIVRVPWEVVKNLHQKVEASRWREQQHNESMRDDQQRYAKVEQVNTSLKVRLDDSKDISPNLFGIFFEDINYSADGGLYAEMIENRDFEYNANDHGGWKSDTNWKMEGTGTAMSIETDTPIHPHNAHYARLTTNEVGAHLTNPGWEGIVLQAKARYDLSLFLRGKGKVKVSLVSDGKILASHTFSATTAWKQQKCVLSASASADKAVLHIEPLQTGTVDVDMVSLFPQDTYKGHKNGLRKDLAETIEAMHPRFVRFPGGCLSHGQGIDNIYHWQATVGELWERQPDFNIWNYHQTRGLGFYEYFVFCEDLGAEPLPVLAAGVPCQNSHKGGNGQQGGIPFEKDLKGKPSPYTYNGKPLTMESYLQELLDLIEWANGDAKKSPLAAMRAKAGHPKPFNLKYLGIGNEDLLGDVFNERFDFLYEGVTKAHPEITVVGTVGPFWEGSDYEFGWKHARQLDVPIVDEHYYNNPGWYFHNEDFYDRYPRSGTKVYLGEWASRGNRMENALAEAMHVTQLERNGDVVVMSSYAPLLAKHGHTQWNPDLIYFNSKEVLPTVNYWVQALAGQNAGDAYIYADRSVQPAQVAERVGSSVVKDKSTGDIIIKLVNALPVKNTVQIDLGSIEGYQDEAQVSILSGNYDQRDLKPTTSTVAVDSRFDYQLPPYAFAVIRLQAKK